MNPWLVIGLLVSGVVLLWALIPDLRGLLLLGGFGALGVWAFRSKPYPEGRSKAHGVDKEQLRRAQAVERWLLEQEQEWNDQREEWQVRTRWERIAGQAGLHGSAILRVEAVTSGFHFRVELAPGGTIDQVRPAARALESALDLRPGAVEVEQDEDRARVVLLRVTPAKTVTAKPIPWPGPAPDASILKPVQLGAYQDGGPLEVALIGQHVLIGGTTDAGKSGVLNILVAHLVAARDVEPWGIDLKGGAELGFWEDSLARIATNVADAEKLLVRGQLELDRRLEVMASRRWKKWQPTPQEPAIVICIDEQRVLSASKRAVELQEDITGRGRATMVTIIAATQHPTMDSLGSNLIAANFNVRIGLRVTTVDAANVIFGKGMATQGWTPHRIPPGQPGTLYLYAANATVPRLARAFYATEDKIEAVAKRYVVTPRPGLAKIPPAGAVHTNDTNPGETAEDGGGEATLLAALPGRLDDLADRLDIPRTSLYRRLVKLRDAGRVENRDGLWWAVP